MTEMTVEQALSVAVGHHQAGHFAEAEDLYRRVLAVDPNNVQALHLLAALAQQVGQVAAAVELNLRAIELKPDFVEPRVNLILALRALGRSAETIPHCEVAM